VHLCRIYEYCRYALLLLEGSILFPKAISPAVLPQLLRASDIVGPISFLGFNCPALHFPEMPYRRARELWKPTREMLWIFGLKLNWRFDPEMLVAMIEWFANPLVPSEQKLELILPEYANRRLAEDLLSQVRKKLKRGAGARIRQDKTALKYLGATKLLAVMSVPEAIEHTERVLGHPLFFNESEWSRAKGRALQNLQVFHDEALLLQQAFNCSKSGT
jgi:hypothetical protein